MDLSKLHQERNSLMEQVTVLKRKKNLCSPSNKLVRGYLNREIANVGIEIHKIDTSIFDMSQSQG